MNHAVTITTDSASIMRIRMQRMISIVLMLNSIVGRSQVDPGSAKATGYSTDATVASVGVESSSRHVVAPLWQEIAGHSEPWAFGFRLGLALLLGGLRRLRADWFPAA